MVNANELKGMNAKQVAWFLRMSDIMDAVHSAWCHDRALAYELFTPKFQQDVTTACERLGLNLARAWDEDGWDGEEDAGINTTSRQLHAIRLKMAGREKEIPAYYFISYQDEMDRRAYREDSRQVVDNNWKYRYQGGRR